MRAALRGFAVALALSALTGCMSCCELSRHVSDAVRVDGGEKPLATFMVANVSYSLFGLLPLTSGNTWQEGPYEDFACGGISFFADHCTLDDNLKSVHCALREVGSDRVCNIVNTMDKSSGWSLFLIRRKVLRTTCLILEPKKENQTK